VYDARDIRLNRRVALKIPILSPDAERSAKLARFHRECQVLAHLTSEPGSNIPTLLMVGEHEGLPFSVREFVDGRTLQQRASERSINLRVGLELIASVARIVDRVHAQGFAHRNLSPENVLVSTDGTARLIGFGRVGMLAGSDPLAQGTSGVPRDVDVRGLQDLLRWLCETLGQPIPPALEKARRSGSLATPAAFAETVGGYLLGTPI
jgi:serine/threonine protein kinase